MRQTIHVRVTYQTPTPHLLGQQTGTTHLYLVSNWSIRGAITSLHIPPTVVLSILFYDASINLDCRPSPTWAIDTLRYSGASGIEFTYGRIYRGADKSLARPTSRCVLFDGQNISFGASLVIYINSNNIPPIMIINRIYENQNLLSL